MAVKENWKREMQSTEPCSYISSIKIKIKINHFFHRNRSWWFVALDRSVEQFAVTTGDILIWHSGDSIRYCEISKLKSTLIYEHLL